jgi:hypothetical protein
MAGCYRAVGLLAYTLTAVPATNRGSRVTPSPANVKRRDMRPGSKAARHLQQHGERQLDPSRSEANLWLHFDTFGQWLPTSAMP